MKDLRLEDGDLVLMLGEIALVEDQDELKQTIYIGMQTNIGEWFLDPRIGLDQSIFYGKNINEEEMRDEVARGVSQESRVQSVDSVEILNDTKERTVSVKFTCTANDDEISSEVSF